MANSSSIDKGPVNLLIHVSHFLQEEHIVPIQLIVVSVNHLVVVFKQFFLLFKMLFLGLFFVELFL